MHRIRLEQAQGCAAAESQPEKGSKHRRKEGLQEMVYQKMGGQGHAAAARRTGAGSAGLEMFAGSRRRGLT